MCCKSLCISVLMFWCMSFFGLYAQETIPAGGGEATGSGGSVSYSVGQLVSEIYTGTNGSVAQGVQQAFEISIVLETKYSKKIHLKCMAYPNPVTDYLLLKIEDYNNRNLKYLLFDSGGKLIEKNNVDENETRISMMHLPPATYFIKIIEGNQEVKTFKIIKN